MDVKVMKFISKARWVYKYYIFRRTVPQKNKNFHGTKVTITLKKKRFIMTFL
jgi:hypothetical protein